MTREKFIEELNFNCKVDGKEVWLNIMPCLEKLLDEHEAQLKAKNERIRELDEAMKPKTCEGCRYGAFGVNGLGFEVECRIGYNCSRGREDRYELKE